jgi:AbrB family looped-hinge helix DNA binding protein
MALVRVKGKYQVTIPKEVRRKLGLRVGDYLEVEVQGSAILLKPKALLDKDETLEKLRALLEKLREKRVALSEEEVEREVLEALRAVRNEGTGG